MNRSELLKSTAYWTQMLQLDVLELVNNHISENNMTRTQFAEKLGVSKGYLSQILNGSFDHKLSKLVELALACGCVPSLSFVPAERAEDVISAYHLHPVDWNVKASYVEPATLRSGRRGFQYNPSTPFTVYRRHGDNVKYVA